MSALARAHVSHVAAAIVLLMGLVPAVLHAAEFPEYPEAPSAFTTRIEARAYDDRFETVEDLLQNVPGVRLHRFGGLGAHSTASIRGSKSEQVLVLLDGVRLNSAQRGSVDLSTLPLRLIEHIDVVRGSAAAVRFGSDAVGGVIAITSRRPEEAVAADASLTTGRLQTLGTDLLFSGARGALTGLVAWERLGSENDFRFTREAREVKGGLIASSFTIPPERHTRINADFVRDTVQLQGQLETGPRSLLSATLHLHRTDRGQPAREDTAGAGASDAQVSCPTAEEQYRRGLFTLSWRHLGLGPGALEASLFHRLERSELHDPEGGCGLIDPRLRAGRDRIQSLDLQTGVELRYAMRQFRVGRVGLRPRSALTLRHDRMRADEVDDPHRFVASGFLQQEIELFDGRLRLIPALGLELVHGGSVRVIDPATTNPISVRPDGEAEWLPRVGAIVRLSPDLRLKANWGRAYRRPNFNELFFPNLGYVRGNPALRAEESWELDVGVELRRRRLGPLSELLLEATGFDRDLEHSIELLQVGAFQLEPRNVAPARVRGGELRVAFTVQERFGLDGSYTFLDTELRHSGKPLPHRPRNRYAARAWLGLGPGRVWAETRYEDAITLRETGELSIDPSRQLDLGVTLRLARLPGLGWLPGDLEVSSEWVNVSDERRIDSTGFPLPGRLWYLRVRGRLERSGKAR